MERKEEIFSAAASFANAVSSGIQDSYFDIVLKTYQEGAKWADQHPRKGLVDIEKVCKFLDGYSFIPTYVIKELKNEFSKGE